MKKSNINVFSVLIKFPPLYFRNFFRRFFYEYCLRNPDMKFISLTIGIFSFIFGFIYSLSVWRTGISDDPLPSGTVGIALISLLVGINFISYFFVSDMKNYPKSNLLTI